MKAFKNYNGPGGGSNSNPQNGQGGFNQQSGQGHQQQQGGYQTNPKQLNGGQYHVFTTSLCKQDQKLHKRAVNAVEPAVPRYLRWSEQPIVWSREDHPPRVDNPGHLALVVALKLVDTNSLKCSWMEALASTSFITRLSVAWG